MAGTSNEIFQRIEKKYLMTRDQYDRLRERISDYMKVDEYGLSTICNVYYDTDNFELIRRSNEKPVYKEKLRLRSYGVPEQRDRSFIEIKKKWQGVVYKRRIQLPFEEAWNYLNHDVAPTTPVNQQILREIDYFKQLYQPIPKMYIAYDRIAMYGVLDSSIRITFDFHIRYRQEDINLALGDAGHLLLDRDAVLMEIKVGGAYPLWLADALCDLAIYPTSFSKYGKIYLTILQQKLAEEAENKTAAQIAKEKNKKRRANGDNEDIYRNGTVGRQNENQEEVICLPA